VEEIVRILLPGGKALIYVWAKEQERDKIQSNYLKQDRKNRKKVCDSELKYRQQHNEATKSTDTTSKEVSCQFTSLPIHTNRTQFQHQDLLVPWKLKLGGKAKLNKNTEESHLESSQEVPTFYRYYHVFEEGELELLCSSVKGAKPVQSYYDQGNWCIVLEKV
jgi:alkylated DNA repair protein alkB family protein 8